MFLQIKVTWKLLSQNSLEKRVSVLHSPPILSLLFHLAPLLPSSSPLPLYFDEKEICKNTRKDTNVINPQTGVALEVDVWLPERHLSFEFQVCHSSFYCE